MNLHRSCILVTGAGSGIGKAAAEVLEHHFPRATLVLSGRNLEKLENTRHLLKRPRDHRIVRLDLTDKASIINLGEYFNQESLTLRGLVLNAGVGGENEYGSNDRWDEIIATNLTGPYLLVNELLPFMLKDENEFKGIVFVSSILARLGVPRYQAYCASKAGLLGLMRSFAAELAPQKVLVNAICPGWVDTDMSTQGLEQMAKHLGKSSKEIFAEQMSFVPLKKMASPREIGEMISFLLPRTQTSITGQTFDVNNGAIMP